MLMFAAIGAAILYLLPVGIVTFVWTGRRDVPATTLALAIPNVVALDLLGILSLTLFMQLEVAVVMARIAWLLGGIAVLIRRRKRAPDQGPLSFDLPMLAAVAAAAFLAAYLSTRWSTTYSVWDRDWHVPLVASLRGQKLPFQNVYYFPSGLRYHFSGDVLAATLQTLSFDVLHSDHALSLAHDVMFALTGSCSALLFMRHGHRSAYSIVLAVLAVLANGPVSILRGAGAESLHGYSALNFFIMSFRPHVNLAGLLFVGFFGAIIENLRRAPADGAEAGPLIFRASVTLLVTSALLAITDETSAGLLGLALGTTWLVHARVIHPSRRRGILLLVAMLVAFVGVNYLFGGSLAPGGPVRGMKWVPGRSPGYFGPPVPLASSEGWRLLLFDTLPLSLSLLGLSLCWRRGNTGRIGVAILFLLVLDACCLLGLTRFEVNGVALEAHRFATAALFAVPVFALAWLPVTASGSAAKHVLLAAVLLPAFSTAAWFRNTAPQELAPNTQPLLGRVNCRRRTALHAFEGARATYVAEPVWYLWGGCHSSLTPGVPDAWWGFPIHKPLQGLPALEILEEKMLTPNESLHVVCPGKRSSAKEDPICAFALERGSCTVITSKLQTCLVGPAERPALLSALRQ
jgi:hypothetical protein